MVSESRVATDHEMIKAISVAWNCWMNSRELKLIKVNFDAGVAKFDGVGELAVKTVRAARVEKK
jgi:hypothetical protein